MEIILHALLFVAAFLGMEWVAWFTHKYIMHGFLWVLHKSHHDRNKGFFEWNDLFAVFFAALAIWLCVLGLPEADWRFWIGAGITTYGIAYFLVHDVFVHQRLKMLRNTNNDYFKALRRAHKIHHKKITKEDGEAFGFLWVSRKYFKNNSAK